MGHGDSAQQGLDEKAIPRHDHGRERIRQAERHRRLRCREHGQAVCLESPEVVVVDDVIDRFLDGRDGLPVRVLRAQLLEPGAGQVSQLDAVALGLLGEWRGSEINR
ncbi:MAG: hypothetical protein L0Z62_48615 [Gemmataceae bacterium]|nr:hypothetical protein [Gemmataceae bacterium]